MKKTSFLFLLASILVLSAINSCKKDTTNNNNNNNTVVVPSTVTDGGGNVYNVVKVGTQYWTKENSKLITSTGSECYENSAANCTTYGRLYKYAAAINACPTGWRLPTDADWKTLEMFLGMSQADADKVDWSRGTTEGTKLKVGGSTGFEAKFGGEANPQNLFGNIGTDGYFWTSTTSDATDAYDREISGGVMIKRYFVNLQNSYSVRCIKN